MKEESLDEANEESLDEDVHPEVNLKAYKEVIDTISNDHSEKAEVAAKVVVSTIDSSDDEPELEVGTCFGSLQDSCELAKGRRLKDPVVQLAYGFSSSTPGCVQSCGDGLISSCPRNVQGHESNVSTIISPIAVLPYGGNDVHGQPEDKNFKAVHSSPVGSTVLNPISGPDSCPNLFATIEGHAPIHTRSYVSSSCSNDPQKAVLSQHLPVKPEHLDKVGPSHEGQAIDLLKVATFSNGQIMATKPLNPGKASQPHMGSIAFASKVHSTFNSVDKPKQEDRKSTRLNSSH